MSETSSLREETYESFQTEAELYEKIERHEAELVQLHEKVSYLHTYMCDEVHHKMLYIHAYTYSFERRENQIWKFLRTSYRQLYWQYCSRNCIVVALHLCFILALKSQKLGFSIYTITGIVF
jgi:hypothetical protein